MWNLNHFASSLRAPRSHLEGLITTAFRELDESPLFFRLNNTKAER